MTFRCLYILLNLHKITYYTYKITNIDLSFLHSQCVTLIKGIVNQKIKIHGTATALASTLNTTRMHRGAFMNGRCRFIFC